MRIHKHHSRWYLLLLLGALPALYLAVNAGGNRPVYNPTTRAASQNFSLYTNAVYGFTFGHLSSYLAKEIADGQLTLRRVGEKVADDLVEVIVTSDRGDYKNSVSEFSIARYKAMQEVEYKNPTSGNVVVNKVVGSRFFTFTNPKGLKGYEIYLTIESRDVDTNSLVQRGEIGPLFSFDISGKDSSKPAIFVHAYGDRSDEKLAIMRSVADTLEMR